MNEMESMQLVGKWISAERRNQEAKRAAGKFRHGKAAADSDTSDEFKCTVLGEEYGEVCKEVCEAKSDEKLKWELVQVAAVAVAWLQSMLQTGRVNEKY